MSTEKAVMCTGGIDSTVLLYSLAANYEHPIPITIDYGQDAFKKQEENLRFHIRNLNLPDLVIIKVNYLDWQKKPGLFTPAYIPNEENPLKDYDKLRYDEFFVEGRNLIMVAYALAYCSAHKIDELLAGYCYSNEEWQLRRSYKLITGDNSPHFVDMINLLTLVGFSHQVRFRAPYYEKRLSKKNIVCLGRSLAVDFDKTYSCYFIPECGKCDNCLIRKEALYEKRTTR